MNILEYGTRRQGKSTLALALAASQNQRVIVFDPNDQFPAVRVVSVSRISEWLAIPLAPGAFAFARVGPFETDDMDEAFSQFCDALQDVRDISIIVDEAHILQGSNYVHPRLDRWIRRTPKSVCLIQTTHRVVDVNIRARYHMDHVFFFYADLESELKKISETYGPDVALRVSTLKPHHVLHFMRVVGGVAQWEVWDKPGAWYINIGNDNQ